MQWEDGYKQMFPNAEWVESPTNEADLHIFMWCDQTTVNFINSTQKYSKYIVFVRRYEFYNNWIEELDWSKVDEIITVNDFIAFGLEQRIKRKPHIIYNGVNPDKWKFKERQHGNRIAMLGFVNQKKNFPLAMQILMGLSKDYELHIAGAIQDGATVDYLSNMANALNRKIIFYNQIPSQYVDMWLEDKNYILNTAISEGCPNNVLEAMAKGIKPIIHNWPNAKQQFGKYVFNTIDEALEMIHSDYNSQEYRNLIETKFGIDNFLKVKQIVDRCMEVANVV
jgi:glycosyltransferase involved in cell wall biosynthesis